MTEQMHPMVPPNILLNNWESDWFNERENVDVLLIQAYQAGADAELEACCEWLSEPDPGHVDLLRSCAALRAARRPKPTSLKEQALKALDQADKGLNESEWQQRSDIIRHALKRLQELEKHDD